MSKLAFGVAATGSAEPVEKITWRGVSLAYIIRSELLPTRTTFLTPPEFKQQVGFVVYPAGGEIQRHVHRALERRLIGTSEVLVVRQGRCEIDIYNDERELVATRELRQGDIMLMVAGGHGFRMLEDTVFLEVKQGPYTGEDEKERF
jgi:mannose-6-phosphate isomerase-like protein (cupin superfamily)